MKKNIIFYSILFVAFTFLTSCSHRLVGTWEVQSYETVKPGDQSIKLSNIGTMQFKRNGKGEKNLQYKVFETIREDSETFRWTVGEDYITIDGSDSDLAKTWIVVEDKRGFQKWKSTDGMNQIQILKLTK